MHGLLNGIILGRGRGIRRTHSDSLEFLRTTNERAGSSITNIGWGGSWSIYSEISQKFCDSAENSLKLAFLKSNMTRCVIYCSGRDQFFFCLNRRYYILCTDCHIPRCLQDPEITRKIQSMATYLNRFGIALGTTIDNHILSECQ